MTSSENPSPVAPAKRVRVAQALALVALLAALVGALGPADHLRTVYSWPPETLPAGSPKRVWYTPLLLARHRPETISARIPCALPPPLPGAPNPVTVVATARYPERADALAVVRRGRELLIAIGDETLDRVRLPSARVGARECAYDLRLGEGYWTIAGGPTNLAHHGGLGTLPRVTGLFSGLSLRSGSSLSVDVTTTVHAARTTARQAVAWTIAALSIAAALLLVAVGRKPREPWSTAVRLARRASAHAHPVDAVVGAALLGWWLIAPAHFDDGWIIASEQMFSPSHGFSDYYATLAANYPLNYWLDWAQHWLVEPTSALLVLRLPALLCLAAAWVLCRWILARVTASTGADAVALSTLACAFVIQAMAWGMTLRSEPVTALLVIGVAASVVRFLERETAAPMAAAAVLVPLALTAHPAGAVSLAAVLVAAPQLLRWARSHLSVATTIVAASVAWLGVLVFVGSDVEQRAFDARTTRTFSRVSLDETHRYAFLSDEPWATPVRRAAVALLLLAVLAFVLRRRRRGTGLLDLPAAVVAVGLVLLIATPSKFPAHFGTLIGIGAVAVAAEVARIRAEATRSTGPRAWPFLAVGAAMLVGAWTGWTRAQWNPVDLMTLDWEPAFEAALPLSRLAIALPLLLLAGGALVAVVRGRADRLYLVPWRVASWTALVLAVPPIAFTVGTVVADSVKTGSWTLARQNLETTVGDPGCGLADDVLVPVQDSARPLSVAGIGRSQPTPAWVPPAPVGALPRYALSPTGAGSARTPWFELPGDRRVGFFVAGIPGSSDVLQLEWARIRRDGIDRLLVDNVTDVVSGLSGNATWRFIASGDLATHPDATAVRLSFSRGTAPGAAVAVTAPVTYVSERLAGELERTGSRSLVYPELFTSFPCAHLPTLRDGAVEVPRHLVVGEYPGAPLRYTVTSPFLGLLDLYELEPLSVTDSSLPPRRVLVFEVDQRIPGSKLAPPVKTTLIS